MTLTDLEMEEDNMACKCRICMTNEVDNPGDVCELCAIGMDPYAGGMGGGQVQQNQPVSTPAFGAGVSPKRGGSRKVLIGGGTSLANTDPYGNDMTPTQPEPAVQVYKAGQVPQQVNAPAPVANTQSGSNTQSGNQPLTTGITKNITVDIQKRSFLEKWFRSVFMGIPFAFDDDVTMFQVFPDYSGTALNAQGNACDQVIVYGKLNNGEVSENNEVEVYGRRDSRNNIIAKTIKNKASGSIVKPQKTISAGVMRILGLLFGWLLFTMITSLGVEGIVWAVVIILALTNAPLLLKIVGGIIGIFFSLLKKLF